jgi:hypothetical protein
MSANFLSARIDQLLLKQLLNVSFNPNQILLINIDEPISARISNVFGASDIHNLSLNALEKKLEHSTDLFLANLSTIVPESLTSLISNAWRVLSEQGLFIFSILDAPIVSSPINLVPTEQAVIQNLKQIKNLFFSYHKEYLTIDNNDQTVDCIIFFISKRPLTKEIITLDLLPREQSKVLFEEKNRELKKYNEIESKEKEAETEGGEAETEGGEAETEGGEAETEGGEAETEGGEAETEGGEAETEGGESETEGGEAESEEGEAESEEGEAESEVGEAESEVGESETEEGEAESEEGESETEGGEAETEEGESETEEGESETEEGESETEGGEAESKEGESETEEGESENEEGESESEEGESETEEGEAETEEGEAESKEGESETEEGEAETEGGEAETEGGEAESKEGESETEGGESETEEGESETEESEAETEEGEAEAETEEGEAETKEGEAETEEGEAETEEGEAETEEGEAESEEGEAESEEGESKSKEREAESEEGEAEPEEGEADLAYHSDEKIAALAGQIDALQEILAAHSQKLTTQVKTSISIAKQMSKPITKQMYNNLQMQLNIQQAKHQKLLTGFKALHTQHQQLLNHFLDQNERFMNNNTSNNDRYHKLVQKHRALLQENASKIESNKNFLTEMYIN